MNDAPSTSLGKRRGEDVQENGPPRKMARKDRKIIHLTPGFHKDGLIVRVASDIVEKSWGQGTRGGKMLSCLVSDDSGEVRMIGFNAVVDRVRELLVRDGVFDLNTFACRLVKEDFRSTVLKLEIVLSLSSVVKVVVNVSRDSLVFARDFVDLKKVQQVGERIVNLCGVVVKVEDSQSLAKKRTGESILKRDVILLDEEETPFYLTLWEPQPKYRHITTFVHVFTNVLD